MCKPIQDGFRADLFNGMTHGHWVQYDQWNESEHYIANETKIIQETPFDLDAKLTAKIEERTELGYTFSAGIKNGAEPSA
jgi:hypothetical protein